MEHRARRADEDGDIDLAQYAAALGRRWRTIALATGLALLASLGATQFLASAAPRFQAHAAVVLTGTKYRLQLDPKFTTVDTLNSLATNRAEEYQAVADGSETARAARDRVATATGRREFAPTEIKAKGNVVNIVATSPDPALAAATANAMAGAVADRLDAVYGVGEADQTALQKELADAVARHEAAVAKLAQLTREDRTEALSREIAQKDLAIQTLTGQQNGLLRGRLALYYQTSTDLNQIRRDAESLRNQIRDAGQAPASTAAHALALMNLQTRLAVAGSGRSTDDLSNARALEASRSTASQTPVPAPPPEGISRSSPTGPQLQVGVDSLLARSNNQQDMLRDVDAVIEQTRRRQDAVQAEFTTTLADVRQRADANARSLIESDDQTRAIVDKLTAEIQALRAQQQEQQQRRDVLTQEVDLAKTARTTLETKLREASISAATAGGKAVVASSAVPPTTRSFPPPLSRTLPLAGFLGLLLGAVLAIGLDTRRKRLDQMERPVRVEDDWRASEPVGTGTAGE